LNVMLLISVPLSDLARKYDLDQPGNWIQGLYFASANFSSSSQSFFLIA
jgi:hypothetical protein